MFKILFVEDDISFRQLICDLVQSQFPSVQVYEAKTSTEALFQIEDSCPDLIVLNINLFDGGLALCREVKSICPQLPVVMTANQDIAECRQAVFRVGANCLISKDGAFIEEILALIEGILTFHDDEKYSANEKASAKMRSPVSVAVNLAA